MCYITQYYCVILCYNTISCEWLYRVFLQTRFWFIKLRYPSSCYHQTRCYSASDRGIGFLGSWHFVTQTYFDVISHPLCLVSLYIHCSFVPFNSMSICYCTVCVVCFDFNQPLMKILIVFAELHGHLCMVRGYPSFTFQTKMWARSSNITCKRLDMGGF